MTTQDLAPPQALPVDPDGIVAELKNLRQWVCWTYERREDQWTKVPINPATGRKASVTNSATWATFADALACTERHGLPGIGFVVTSHDPYIGFDLDEGRNPETGEIAPWAAAIIERLSSYAELSPSGTGMRVWIRSEATGLLPDGSGGRRKGDIEVYGADHYLTVTGHRLSDSAAIEERTAELAALFTELFGQTPDAICIPSRTGSTPVDDHKVLELARQAANAAKFTRLWAGDTTAYDGDDSAADLALLGILGFYTQDADQLDRLFRRSGLYRPKWERPDYAARTITKALTPHQVYQPAWRPGGPRVRLVPPVRSRRAVVDLGRVGVRHAR